MSRESFLRTLRTWCTASLLLVALSPFPAAATNGGALGNLLSVTIIGGAVRVGFYGVVDPNCSIPKYERLEIWALTVPYSPSQHDPYAASEGRQGYQIASKDFGLLDCNTTPRGIVDLALFTPPPGTYTLSAFLRASPLLDCRTPDGFCILDYENNALLQTFGASAVAQSAPPPFTPTTGLWWDPNEPGSGYNIDVKHGTLVTTVFSYKGSGDSEWYLASGPLVDGTSFTSKLTKYRNGACISCSYSTATPVGDDGSITINFASPTSAVLTLPSGRVITIQPQDF